MLVPEPLPEDWRAALRAIAERTRAAFEAHPWGLDAEPQRPRRRINIMRHIDQSLRAVEMLGLGPQRGGAVLMAIDDYTIGHCVRSRARSRMLAAIDQGPGAAVRSIEPELDPEVAAAIEAGELPLLQRTLDLLPRRAPLGVPPAGEFEQGLEWLLDGIAALAER